MNPQAAADLLAGLRLEGRTIAELPAEHRPGDLDTGYAVQSALVRRLEERRGGTAAGYKIGCTNRHARELLGTDAPVFGRLSSCFLHESPATIAPHGFAMLGIEPEFAFRVARDVSRGGAPYSAAAIKEYLGALVPAIELVGHRFAGWNRFNGPVLVADNAVHQAFVPGQGIDDWRHLDLPGHAVELRVNGELKLSGRGDNVLGDPLNAMAWLANELLDRGLQLRAGEVVTTGACTDICLAQPGDRVLADFGALGRVEIAFDARAGLAPGS